MAMYTPLEERRIAGCGMGMLPATSGSGTRRSQRSRIGGLKSGVVPCSSRRTDARILSEDLELARVVEKRRHLLSPTARQLGGVG